jgi:formylglycine-generating enzyme required for sulfatase activity
MGFEVNILVLNRGFMKIFSRRVCGLLLGAILAAGITPSWANNLSVSNVSLGSRDLNANTVVVKFDVSIENSWRNKINHDAVWLTVRLHNPNNVPLNKKLCQMTVSGITPTGFSTGSQSDLEFYVPTDKNGVFLRRSANASPGTVKTQNAQVTIDYSSCGFVADDQIMASVVGIEMVYIPQGAFYAGDHSASTASLNQGSGDSDPWYINSESAFAVSNSVSDGFHYVSANNPGESSTGASFSISADFPKGYNGFYVMKYEITEGQWVEFVNSLPNVASRANHDLTDGTHKNSDTVIYRNTVSCSGAPLSCATERPSRAIGYLSWKDLSAFLDWAALRPVTELEFEKIARGPQLAVDGEYVWGSKDIGAATALSGSLEDASEEVITAGANAHYDNQTLSGGDSSLGVQHQQGPLRSGSFSSSASTRISSGASYYGVMEMSGNLKEWTVTLGNPAGRNFTGLNGNGTVSADSGYEGNADVSGWPGLDAVPSRGITSAAGAGFRGGSWADTADRLRTSDRLEAALETNQALNTYGGRGARTYDGQ